MVHRFSALAEQQQGEGEGRGQLASMLQWQSILVSSCTGPLSPEKCLVAHKEADTAH